jgi:hypothetical protein
MIVRLKEILAKPDPVLTELTQRQFEGADDVDTQNVAFFELNFFVNLCRHMDSRGVAGPRGASRSMGKQVDSAYGTLVQ